MSQLSTHIIDRFIAPGSSALVRAEIPDMSSYDKDSAYWVANFFLNSSLRAGWKAPLNAYAFNFHRRAEMAFKQHAQARAETLRFIEGGSQSASCYSTALFHWETFLGQTWHAFKLLQKGLGATIYVEGSGAVEERLNNLYNQMKHVESRIAAGQMLPGATVPVWLTCEGLESVDASLTYVETADLLKDVAKWAAILSDPMQARAKLEAVGA